MNIVVGLIFLVCRMCSWVVVLVSMVRLWLGIIGRVISGMFRFSMWWVFELLVRCLYLWGVGLVIGLVRWMIS